MSQDDVTYSTLEAAKLLGMAVRSVQLMVDRGELQAWKTPGGHRRISGASLDAVLRARGRAPLAPEGMAPAEPSAPAVAPPRVLLIEDSVHFQNLVRLLVAQRFPEVERM